MPFGFVPRRGLRPERRLMARDCVADVVLEGATMPLNGTWSVQQSVAGDNCPDTFWIEVRNPSELYRRGATSFCATVRIAATYTKGECEDSTYTLIAGLPDPATGSHSEQSTAAAEAYTNSGSAIHWVASEIVLHPSP